MADMWDINEEEWYKQIFKEFSKTKQDLNEDINIMRNWSKTQLHFPEEPSDNVLRYVILYKFSIEKAKQKLDMYYTIRSLMPELHKSIPLSPKMVLQSKIVYCVPLPKTTTDFKRIIFTQINPIFGPELFNHERLLEQFFNVIELLIQEDKCYNFHIIFDCTGLQLGHIPKISPMVVRKFSVVMEKVYSNRIASLYMVNFPKILESVVNNVIKPMLSRKLKSRLHLHSGTDIVLQTFGKSVLPKDIGGEERSLDELTDCLLEKYEARKDRFEVLRTLRVNESLRPQKLVNDDILGYYGNLKKMNVD